MATRDEWDDAHGGRTSQPEAEIAASVDRDAFHSIFEHMLNAMAYCRMLYENGQPCDCLFLYTNPAFEQQTGLKAVCGKRLSEIVPGIRARDRQLIERLGRIAQGGAPEKFEVYVNALEEWLTLSAYSPAPEHFVGVFDVITQRKRAEERLKRSQERYLDIFDNTSDLIQCVAPDGSFIYTNRSWRETLGYNEDDVRSLTLADVLHPDSAACCQDRFRRLLDGETLNQITFKFLARTGETIHLAGDCGAIVKNGETLSTRGIFRNISDTVEAEAALRTSEARYRALYENAPDIFATIDRAGEILSINRIGAAMLGYRVDELRGESASKIVHPEDQRAVFAYLNDRFAESGSDEGLDYRKLRKDGSIFWVHLRATLDPDVKGTRLLAVCRDITERRVLAERLAHQATHDTLTNLINRREFELRLHRVLTSPAEPGDGHVLCFLDLDRFKIINDTCGHAAGDELLRQVAALLQGQMRSRDTLARVGGDEFAVLMEHCPLGRAVRLAEKLRSTLEDFVFHWRAHRFSIGVSIGVLPIRTGLGIADTLALADSACYAAKKTGGNGVHVHSLSDPSSPD